MNDVTIEKKEAYETIVTLSADRLTELLQAHYPDLVPPANCAKSIVRHVPVIKGAGTKEEKMVALRVILESKKQIIL